MRALLQRVKEASVSVDGRVVSDIGNGLLVFLGVEKRDTEELCAKLLEKVVSYRMFSDEAGKMNQSLSQSGGELLVVSQFTLVANTKKGLRPSFSSAGLPKESEVLYESFISLAREKGLSVKVGQFGADMQVSLINDGPVTFLIEV